MQCLCTVYFDLVMKPIENKIIINNSLSIYQLEKQLIQTTLNNNILHILININTKYLASKKQ